jgi:hypothetical protein
MLLTDCVTNALKERWVVTIMAVFQCGTAGEKNMLRRRWLSLGRININPMLEGGLLTNHV